MSMPMDQMPPQPQPQPASMPPQPTADGLDPAHVVKEVVLQYMDYVLSIKNSPILGDTTKSQIMVQMAQSISYLYPLANPQPDGGGDGKTGGYPAASMRAARDENKASQAAAKDEANLQKQEGMNQPAIPTDVAAIPGMNNPLPGM